MAGSLAVVGVGAAGLLLLPNGDASAPGASDASSIPVTTAGSANAWRCEGDLGASASDIGGRYFETCVPTELPDDVAITIPPTTGPPITMPIVTIAPTVDTSPVEQTYAVVEGDSVYGIAALHGIDPVSLADYNAWPEGINHPLQIGDTISIPPGASLSPLPPSTTAA